MLDFCRKKRPSDDTRVRVIGSFEAEICTKMHRNLSGKLRGKFLSTTHGYSMAEIACLNHAFVEVFEQEASQVEGQSVQQKDKRKKAKNIKKEKPKDVGNSVTKNSKFCFCACPSKNVVKPDASGKILKGMLLCCKCVFK